MIFIDCREGICGSCGLVIDGVAHGPDRGAATCQLHMRKFRDGANIHVEPFRSRRGQRMVVQMEAELFGSCTNYTECEAVCPAGISIDTIAHMNRDFLRPRLGRLLA